MKQKPYILITNDDGIHALGIKHLWKSLQSAYDLVIIAPQYEQSSVSLSITIRHPLHIQSLAWSDDTPAWSISGTPADCIKLALNVLLKRRPDLVVSGINRGSNAGRSVLYSGTVGGAIEAVLQDIPGIAFSHSDYDLPDYASTEKYVPRIVEYVRQHPLPPGTLLNVNFPCSNLGSAKGIKLARQGKGHWAEKPDQRSHPSEGHPYYWLGACFKEFEEDPEGDVHLLNQGYITAVPVHVAELTDHSHLQAQRTLFENYMKTT